MSFNFNELPEIYQLELTNACQLKCYMCPRELMKREIGYMDPRLVEKMVERDEFANSYLVELQMYGEPLLHPEIQNIIKILKEGSDVRIGFSTNGLLIKAKLDAILLCDFVTVSLDAMNSETYDSIRKSNELNPYEKIVDGLDELLKIKERPIIDIQLVDLPENKGQLKYIKARYKKYPRTIIRTVPNCTVNIFSKTDAYPDKHELCLNPWMSVSVHWNGDVVPCCFWFDEYHDNAKTLRLVYGNLYKKSLREIWKGSIVEILRSDHLNRSLTDRCKQCCARSPVLLHFRMMMNWFKEFKI